MRKLIDLIGKRFGRWLVLARAPNHTQPSGQQKIMWDVSNGVTLLEEWHMEIKIENELAFHRLYGTRSFTEKDYSDWMYNK